ncbi:hypothetical protein K2173_025820 [Erythroxylum novogranatense]|uniref:Uncharacterized protein n=1 Tax=Erythroxylum novogranatense TaxID=1862640 RepID=A0AAV8SHC2_9ROSI|nr:hypothetical protein K2173_025820 [Erythroxylum novogranatense]
MWRVFEDAYKSPLSIVILDDIESSLYLYSIIIGTYGRTCWQQQELRQLFLLVYWALAYGGSGDIDSKTLVHT